MAKEIIYLTQEGFVKLQAELVELKEQYYEERKTMAKLEEDKKLYMAEYNAKMKPLKQQTAMQMSNLRSGVVEMNAVVYLMPEFEERMMGYYSATGELIKTTPLAPGDQQFSIVDSSNQTGTNN